MNKRNIFWFLLSGLALGLSIGVLIAWVISPLQYVETTPASLRTDFKDDYRFMIASAYVASGDFPRAQARLNLLADPNPIKALADQAQRMLANNSSMEMIQVVADLSEAIQNQKSPPNPTAEPTLAQTASLPNDATQPENSPTTSLASPSATATFPFTAYPVASPTQSATPSPLPSAIFTIAARPQRTATPTPAAAFELSNQSSSCDPIQPGLLQITLTNSAGKPAAGVELVITWFGGEEHFFTGLKPEISYGYADYTMTGSVEYALTLASSGTRVTGLVAPTCTNKDGSTYLGSIHLEFKQP